MNQYAIVDIETTGGYAKAGGITEIAILLHNGKEVEGIFETLINPGFPVPRYISALTGITNAMVASAPAFNEVASEIYNLLNGRIFIAHNANFDHSFIKYHLEAAGFEWNTKKLCTVRLSRRVFPGFIKYGLGHICRELNISIENRHRAGGDAKATTILFEKILERGGEKLIKEYLKKYNREQILPPNLPKEHVINLPYSPGVYYFHNANGKVIYVGKAKCLKYRVVSHFTGSDTGRKRQEFLRNIYSISYKECATELSAFIFESIEIKRLWPEYNYSQKRFEQQYGIYFYEDACGYYRLAIDKKQKSSSPVASFSLMTDAHNMLWKMVKQFQLHAGLCYLDLTQTQKPNEDCVSYNSRVNEAIDWLHSNKKSFLIKEEQNTEANYILIENGKFSAMGSLSSTIDYSSVSQIKSRLNAYSTNEAIESLVHRYAEKNPQKIIYI